MRHPPKDSPWIILNSFSIFPQISWLGVESVSFWVFPRYDYIVWPTDPINDEEEKQGMFGEIRDHAECFGRVFGGKIIYKTKVINLSDKLPTYAGLENVLSKRCERWLTMHYPGWKDPTMYWED